MAFTAPPLISCLAGNGLVCLLPLSPPSSEVGGTTFGGLGVDDSTIDALVSGFPGVSVVMVRFQGPWKFGSLDRGKEARKNGRSECHGLSMLEGEKSLSIFFCPFWVSFSVSIIEGIEGCFVSKEADAVAKWHCQAPKVSRSYVGEFWYICYVLCRFAIVDGHGILAKSLSKSRRVKILSDAVIIDPIWTASERGGYRVWFDGRDGISRNGLYVEVIDGKLTGRVKCDEM
ncbi:hypothetical protein BDP67DRAFT_492160 [Colletotrichum lupini]|nr:hypothetical protein BDP67DRAFT_492160 [Colletotrichum lupini]